MNTSEMLSMTESLAGDGSPCIPAYLEAAKGAVVSRLFPFRDDAEWCDVPEKYHVRTCEIAAYLANKRGGEGEVSHNEGGVSRSYSDAYIPESMFDGMVPFAGLPL